MNFLISLWNRCRIISGNERGNFGGQSAPPVVPVDTAAEDAAAADKAAKAEEEEKKKLQQERGIANTILTGPQGASLPGSQKKTLLGAG
jgi:hypothetical protein